MEYGFIETYSDELRICQFSSVVQLSFIFLDFIIFNLYFFINLIYHFQCSKIFYSLYYYRIFLPIYLLYNPSINVMIHL